MPRARGLWPTRSLWLSLGAVDRYLISYEHMGVARLWCERCECAPVELDALAPGSRVSVMTTHEMRVSPHRRCALHLLVLNKTSSGEHKFKIERLLVEDTHGELSEGWVGSSRRAGGAWPRGAGAALVESGGMA